MKPGLPKNPRFQQTVPGTIGEENAVDYHETPETDWVAPLF